MITAIEYIEKIVSIISYKLSKTCCQLILTKMEYNRH